MATPISKRQPLHVVAFFCTLLSAIPPTNSQEKQLAPHKDLSRYHFTRPLMGTQFHITLYASNSSTAQQLSTEAFQIAEKINHLASDYHPQSEIRQLTAHSSLAEKNTPLPLSPELALLLKQSLTLNQLTNGYYDPTLGHLSKLWRRTHRNGQLPSKASITQALTQSGTQHLQLNTSPEGSTLTLKKTNLRLDLGGIAKGYAADLMLAHLRKNGHPRALITAGGDLRLGDPPPNQTTWRIQIRDLTSKAKNTAQYNTLQLANCAISTSGDLHQFVLINGQRYSHLIDPKTGQALKNQRAATVIAPTATQSDALATALCVAPPAQFPASFSLPANTHARLLWKTDSALHEKTTAHFPSTSASLSQPSP